LAHLLVALVACAAVVLQLVLVAQGGQVLDETEAPGLAARLGRFLCYFTIQSNVLVAVTSLLLARDPGRDGRTWRAVRLAAVLGIAITAVVHFVLLRPLLDLDGLDALADTLLHKVVPVLAVGAWVGWGPRPRIDRRTILLALVWPVAWLTFTLVVRQVTGWVPYPFLDADENGWDAVVVSCLAVTALFVVAALGASTLDRRMRPAPSG
jgi:hypothetical protein